MAEALLHAKAAADASPQPAGAAGAELVLAGASTAVRPGTSLPEREEMRGSAAAAAQGAQMPAREGGLAADRSEAGRDPPRSGL